MITLEEARAQYQKSLASGKGSTCPCCDQLGKIYKRRLNSGMAAVLIRIHLATLKHKKKWISIEEIFGSKKQDKRDWPLLQHWGLIEPQTVRTQTENARGFWRITSKGIQFARNNITVPTYHHIYDGKVVRTSTERADIKKALGTRFDYAKLMSGQPG